MFEKLSNQDLMKWVILIVSSAVFVVGTVVRFFNPSQQIGDINNVFLVVSGLIFGSNIAHLFKKGDKSND